MENLKAWAADMDSPLKRDFVFCYVWTMAKIMAEIACQDKADKVRMEGEMIARAMEGLDKGHYEGGLRSFNGWLFLTFKTVVRDVCFSLHRAKVFTLPLDEQIAEKSGAFKSNLPMQEDTVLLQELHEYLVSFEDDRISRLMHMLFVQDMTMVSACSTLGVSTTTGDKWRDGALAWLKENLYVSP